MKPPWCGRRRFFFEGVRYVDDSVGTSFAGIARENLSYRPNTPIFPDTCESLARAVRYRTRDAAWLLRHGTSGNSKRLRASALARKISST